MYNQSWSTIRLGRLCLYLYLRTPGCLGFDPWKDESGGIYDVMLKFETSLVTYTISFFIAGLQQAQPIWLFKKTLRVFWGTLPKSIFFTQIMQFKQETHMYKKRDYRTSLWFLIPTCHSFYLTLPHFLFLRKSLCKFALWRLVLSNIRTGVNNTHIHTQMTNVRKANIMAKHNCYFQRYGRVYK